MPRKFRSLARITTFVSTGKRNNIIGSATLKVSPFATNVKRELSKSKRTRQYKKENDDER